MIKDGTSANFKDENGQTAFHYCAKYGNAFNIELIILGKQIVLTNFKMCFNKQMVLGLVEAAKALLEKGYANQINIGDKSGDTSLHVSASFGRYK